jgi:hypothetical protein
MKVLTLPFGVTGADVRTLSTHKLLLTPDSLTYRLEGKGRSALLSDPSRRLQVSDPASNTATL